MYKGFDSCVWCF